MKSDENMARMLRRYTDGGILLRLHHALTGGNAVPAETLLELKQLVES